jgi:hypothetical protein
MINDEKVSLSLFLSSLFEENRITGGQQIDTFTHLVTHGEKGARRGRRRGSSVDQ